MKHNLNIPVKSMTLYRKCRTGRGTHFHNKTSRGTHVSNVWRAQGLGTTCEILQSVSAIPQVRCLLYSLEPVFELLPQASFKVVLPQYPFEKQATSEFRIEAYITASATTGFLGSWCWRRRRYWQWLLWWWTWARAIPISFVICCVPKCSLWTISL